MLCYIELINILTVVAVSRESKQYFYLKFCAVVGVSRKLDQLFRLKVQGAPTTKICSILIVGVPLPPLFEVTETHGKHQQWRKMLRGKRFGFIFPVPLLVFPEKPKQLFLCKVQGAPTTKDMFNLNCWCSLATLIRGH